MIEPSSANVACTWTFPYRLLNEAPFTTVGAAGAVTGAATGVVAGVVVGAAVVAGAVAVGEADGAAEDDVTTPAGAAIVAEAPLSVAAKA